MNTDSLRPGTWIAFNHQGTVKHDEIVYAFKNERYPYNWQYLCMNHFVNSESIMEIRKESESNAS